MVHGWGGGPDGGWFLWLRGELERRGFEVYSPAMPNTDTPVIEEWVSHLKKVVTNPDKNTYLIGGSIGCQAIMRYLQEIDAKVGGVLFVAGWLNLKELETQEEKDVAEPWLTTPIDFEKVKKSAGKIIAIFSTNDPFVPLSDTKIFAKSLGAEVSIETGVGHFDGTEYPVILEEFLRLTNQ